MTDERPESIAARTLAHYEANAEGFWRGTRDHDVTQNYEAMLAPFGGRSGLRILDLGCGPGRDLEALRSMGHRPVGLDGCAAFAKMAAAYSGCPVLHQSFFDLHLEGHSFDAIFANASLFHVPVSLMPEVLRRLRAVLDDDGVLFCSNPRSFDVDVEGWNGGRYGSFLTVERWTALISDAGFELERSYLRPSGRPPEEQPWLAMVWKKR